MPAELARSEQRLGPLGERRHDGQLADTLPDPHTYGEFVSAGESIAEGYEAREFSRAMREIMQLADRANQYIDEHKPWIRAKEASAAAEVVGICTQGLNLFRVLVRNNFV